MRSAAEPAEVHVGVTSSYPCCGVLARRYQLWLAARPAALQATHDRFSWAGTPNDRPPGNLPTNLTRFRLGRRDPADSTSGGDNMYTRRHSQNHTAAPAGGMKLLPYKPDFAREGEAGALTLGPLHSTPQGALPGTTVG